MPTLEAFRSAVKLEAGIVLCQQVNARTASHLLGMVLTLITLTLLSAPATALEYRVPVTKQLFACAANGVLRVATQTLLQPCCTEKLKCAQFLSTAGVLRPIRDPRT